MDTSLIYQQLTDELAVLTASFKRTLMACSYPLEQVLAQLFSDTPVNRWPDLNTQALPSQLREDFKRIETILATLSQIELNIYGTCADCEASIETERLIQNPTTQRCKCCTERN